MNIFHSSTKCSGWIIYILLKSLFETLFNDFSRQETFKPGVKGLSHIKSKESQIWNFRASGVRQMSLSALRQIPILTSTAPTSTTTLLCAFFIKKSLHNMNEQGSNIDNDPIHQSTGWPEFPLRNLMHAK